MTQDNSAKILLIVDDSRLSRMMIRSMVLAQHPNWIIIEAASGEEALESVDQNMPNFCTMDINMPGMLGTDATEQILLKYPNIRIAIFSANTQEYYRTHAAKLGAQFVSKPITEKSIVKALEFFELEP
ncbi:MAG: response regulator [Chromatiales bacterium]|nr:response regulator [Chromatiales bacterium]